MIEQSVIHLLLGLSIGVTLSYALAFRKGAEQYAAIGRTLMLLLAGGLVVCSAMLVINLVQHQFQFTYVFRQSSREMPLHLLIASFYSGQEGSFLLWAMFVALIAVVVTPYARRRQYEHESMMLFGIILTFLTLLLVAKNPFAYYWESIC
jgi:Cytochrome c biogenesis factor